MPPSDDAPHVQVESAQEWRDWLEAHHDTERGAWLVTFRVGADRPRVTYEEGVEQALCFGWVDSLGRRVDDARTKLWYAPRQRGSGWSRPNKQRIERLEAAGLMTPAGRAVIDAAKADGSWTLLDDVENLVVPDDLALALAERPGAREHWDAFPRSARRGILEWIVQAKREQTRTGRVRETAERAERGERANEWRGRKA